MSLKDFLSTLQRAAVGVGLPVHGAHAEASAGCAPVGNVGRPHNEAASGLHGVLSCVCLISVQRANVTCLTTQMEVL